MPVACGSWCELTYEPCPDESYTIRALPGPHVSERVDEIYQVDRLVLYLENVPMSLDIGWTVTLGGENWMIESGAFADCVGSVTLVRPRLTCPEEVEHYRLRPAHECPGASAVDLRQYALATTWVHLESREQLVLETRVILQRFRVYLDHVGYKQMLSGDFFRRRGRWFAIEAIGDGGSVSKLPWVEVGELSQVSFAV